MSPKQIIKHNYSYVMRSTNNKLKMKTLCTIDTSDIQLCDAVPYKQRSHLKYSNYISDKRINQKSNQRVSAFKFKEKVRKDTKRLQSNDKKKKSEEHRPYSCNSSNKNSKLKYRRVSGDISVKDQSKSSSIVKTSSHPNNQNSTNKFKLKKKNNTPQLHSTAIKTQYCQSKKINRKQLSRTVANMQRYKTKSSEKSRDKRILTSSFYYPIDENYRVDVLKIVQDLKISSHEEIKLVEMVLNKKTAKFMLKKSRDKFTKQQYKKQLEKYMQLGLYPNNSNSKYPKNILKLCKHYQENKYLYLLYEYGGVNLDWQNGIHKQLVSKMLINDGNALKYILKQIAKGINQLSRRGCTHGNMCINNIIMNISQRATTISLQGKIKLANLSKCFHFSQKKQQLSNFPRNIYTPPQIINYMIFEENNRMKPDDGGAHWANQEFFDRELIEYIGCYDQPWYSDVWGLGIIALELVSGDSISLEKLLDPVSIVSPSHSIESESEIPVEQINQNYATIASNNKQPQIDMNQMITNSRIKKDIRLFDDAINLSQILNIQKKILEKHQRQIGKLDFDKSLQSLIIRMLSLNPHLRPSPQEIIQTL